MLAVVFAQAQKNNLTATPVQTQKAVLGDVKLTQDVDGPCSLFQDGGHERTDFLQQLQCFGFARTELFVLVVRDKGGGFGHASYSCCGLVTAVRVFLKERGWNLERRERKQRLPATYGRATNQEQRKRSKGEK